MQEINMRVNALYDLAVELEYKTQHPGPPGAGA
jgi:hypothetical protein